MWKSRGSTSASSGSDSAIECWCFEFLPLRSATIGMPASTLSMERTTWLALCSRISQLISFITGRHISSAAWVTSSAQMSP
jgi:hypothetical protein